MNPASIKNWICLLKEKYAEHNVQAESLWNMDECGFLATRYGWPPLVSNRVLDFRVTKGMRASSWKGTLTPPRRCLPTYCVQRVQALLATVAFFYWERLPKQELARTMVRLSLSVHQAGKLYHAPMVLPILSVTAPFGSRVSSPFEWCSDVA